MRFVIAEYRDTTLGSAFFAKRPLASSDVLVEAGKGPPGNRTFACISLVRGLSPEDLKMFLTGLEHVYDDVRTIEKDLHAGRWMGRFTVRERALAGTTAAKVVQFQDRFGARWAHLQDGVSHLRLRLKDGVDEAALMAEMRAALAGEGIEAQVEVHELGDRDYGVWDELIQHSLGLAR